MDADNRIRKAHHNDALAITNRSFAPWTQSSYPREYLNSFMYEPILDTSDDHLRKLYADVLKLENEANTKIMANENRI